MNRTARTSTNTQGEILEPAPLVVGDNNHVTLPELPMSDRNIIATNDQDLSSVTAMQISMGLNIFLFGFGLLLIVKIASKSKAISSTGKIIDTLAASAIHTATNSTDDREIKHAHDMRASLESLRRYL